MITLNLVPLFNRLADGDDATAQVARDELRLLQRQDPDVRAQLLKRLPHFGHRAASRAYEALERLRHGENDGIEDAARRLRDGANGADDERPGVLYAIGETVAVPSVLSEVLNLVRSDVENVAVRAIQALEPLAGVDQAVHDALVDVADTHSRNSAKSQALRVAYGQSVRDALQQPPAAPPPSAAVQISMFVVPDPDARGDLLQAVHGLERRLFSIADALDPNEHAHARQFINARLIPDLQELARLIGNPAGAVEELPALRHRAAGLITRVAGPALGLTIALGEAIQAADATWDLCEKLIEHHDQILALGNVIS